MADSNSTPLAAPAAPTRAMIDPGSGKLFDIPFDKVEEAHKSGLGFTTRMTSPDGKNTFDIPQERADEAAKDGLKPVPTQVTSPYEQQLASDTSFYNSRGGKVLRGMKDVVDYGAEGLAGMVSKSAGEKLTQEDDQAKERYNSLTNGGSSYNRIVGRGVAGAIAAAPLAILAPEGTLAAVGRGVMTAGRWLFDNLGTGAKKIGNGALFGGGLYGVGKVIQEVTGTDATNVGRYIVDQGVGKP